MRYAFFDQPGLLAFDNASDVTLLDLRNQPEEVRDQTYFVTLFSSNGMDAAAVQTINVIDSTSDIVASLTVTSNRILNRFPIRGNVALIAAASANKLYGYYELEDTDFPPGSMRPIQAFSTAGVISPITLAVGVATTLGTIEAGQQFSFSARLPDNAPGDPVVLTLTLTPTSSDFSPSTLSFAGPSDVMSLFLDRLPISVDGTLSASVTELTSMISGIVQ